MDHGHSAVGHGARGGPCPRRLVSYARMRSRTAALAAAALGLVACTTGCSPRPVAGPGSPPPPTPVPDYRDLVARHNHAVRNVQRLSAFAVVSLRWQEDGQRRSEQGEGILAVVLPGKLSLTLGKLHDLFRIGSDGQRYWFIDLSDDPAIAHVGRHEQAASTSLRKLDTIVMPHDLIRLLGLLPIDPLREPKPPAVVRYGNQFLIEPPGSRMRILLDEKTARPRRIDLLDAEGFSRVSAQLSRYDHLETTGIPPGSWPTTATMIEIRDLQTDNTAKLSLSDLIGDEEEINDRWFSLESLVEAYEAKVHNLDRP